jgi:hypothetical protein
MYGVHFRPGVIEALGEEGLIVFDTQVRNDEDTGADEKNTRDPEGAFGSKSGCIGAHGGSSLSKTEMVTDASEHGRKNLAKELLAYPHVKLLLGQGSKDSPKGAVAGMKPLA